MKASGLRTGMRVKTNKTISRITLHPGLEIPKGRVFAVQKVIDGKAFVRYEGKSVQLDPADLDRVG